MSSFMNSQQANEQSELSQGIFEVQIQLEEESGSIDDVKFELFDVTNKRLCEFNKIR